MAGHADASARRRHLIIAGTGRAGTTFLVRYFTAMGLDTHLSRRGEDAWLDERAQAGLEDFPLGPDAADLPYLIKNPMLYEFIDQMVSGDSIQIDGVIIPVRNLREATSSRVILERRSMYEHLPWLGYMDKAWDSAGNVPGGLIFSLNALDEARTLSMGLHLLVERLVHANIPMVFLDFPRIVTDGAYLFEKVATFLPEGTTAQAAAESHAKLADPEMVRIEREMGTKQTTDQKADDGDLDQRLDRIALRRELVRLRDANERLNEITLKATADTSTELAELRLQVEDLEKLRTRAVEDIMELRAELKRRDSLYHDLSHRHDELKRYFALASEQLDGLSARAEADWMKRSDSEGRYRVIAAERLMFEYLAGFSDDVASIADHPKAILLAGQLRDRFGTLLGQLETANSELEIVSEQLARQRRYPGRDFFSRVFSSKTFRRMRNLASRFAAPSRVRG